MPEQALSAPGWLLVLLPWLGVLLLAGVAAAVACLWILVQRSRPLEGLGERLEGLDEIRRSLARLVEQRGDLDLRRIEHVLLELRDAQRRLEDALLRASQTPRSPSAPDALPPQAREGGAGLAERVVNRLLALGYERVQIVTPTGELDRLAAGPRPGSNGGGADDEPAPGSGEVLVEARRAGVLCKGRVQVRAGALLEVELQPAYTVFP